MYKKIITACEDCPYLFDDYDMNCHYSIEICKLDEELTVPSFNKSIRDRDTKCPMMNKTEVYEWRANG